ncbi:MAG: hypothetical protein R3C28_07635 [Pirellulaceae bacterium]
MIVEISSDAEEDLGDGFWFYERQSQGLGRYFLSYFGFVNGLAVSLPATSLRRP